MILGNFISFRECFRIQAVVLRLVKWLQTAFKFC